MNSGEWFTLALFLAGSVIGGAAWLVRRTVARMDARFAKLDELILNDAKDGAEKPVLIQRIERFENGLVKLSDIVTEMGLQQARHMGYHERHDENTTDPLLG